MKDGFYERATGGGSPQKFIDACLERGASLVTLPGQFFPMGARYYVVENDIIFWQFSDIDLPDGEYSFNKFGALEYHVIICPSTPIKMI